MAMTTSAELAALRASFEAFLKNYDTTAHEAAAERKEMMTAMTKLSAAQERLAHDMAEVKPVADMVTSLRSRLAGAMIVFGIVGAVAWAGVQFFKQQLIGWLGG